MGWIYVVGIAIGLALDAFAVSIAVGAGLARVTPRHVFRIAFHFGLFQFLMPIVGWYTGQSVTTRVAAYGHWLASGLLGLVGLKMLVDIALRGERELRADPTRGWMLVALSLATSIDALVVGISMAFIGADVLLPCVIIGLVAAAFSAVGITCAGRFLQRWGTVAEVFGALILILVSIRMLIARGR
jgi:putative Mn2+ efflux pump MntP